MCRASLTAVTNDLQEQQLRWKQIEVLCGQRIDSAVTSPIKLEPVPECGRVSKAGETAHNDWLLSSVSGGDSVSVSSTRTLPSRSASDPEGSILNPVSLTGNHASALQARSISDSGTGIPVVATKRNLLREKKGQLVEVSVGETEEGRQPGSLSSSSSCSSLSSLPVQPVSGTDSQAAGSRSSQRHIVPLRRIGKQNSDPSMALSRLAANEQTDLASSGATNLYQNKADYAKDYNSLACSSILRPVGEPVNGKGRRRNKDTLDILDDKRPEENVSDSEVLVKDMKKKRKLFWSKLTK